MPSASFAVLSPSLRNALGVPSTKIPIDGNTFVSYILPPLACHFVVAVLAVTPQTRTVRVALWPLVALMALRAALSVDMSLGKTEEKFNNVSFVVSGFDINLFKHPWRADLQRFPLALHAYCCCPYP